MCIMEIHDMDVSSINKKNDKRTKQTMTKSFVLVVVLKRAILNGSTKCCFKIFLKFSYEEE